MRDDDDDFDCYLIGDSDEIAAMVKGWVKRSEDLDTLIKVFKRMEANEPWELIENPEGSYRLERQNYTQATGCELDSQEYETLKRLLGVTA
jgi:hypothetical protein